jgi:hypothetical protein
MVYADAQESPSNNSNNISSTYLSDKQAIYHIKQINNTVWILGTNASNGNSNGIANIFSGVLENNNSKVSGKWIDSPLSNNTSGGDIDFDLLTDNSNINITLIRVPSTFESNSVAYPANVLTKYDPAIHSPLKIYVTIESILIDIPRSPTADILYTGISGQKNDDDPLTATKYLGPVEDGSNITTNLRVGPFSFDNESDSFKVKILGLDKEDSTTSFTLISLRNTLNQLMQPSYNVSDLVQAYNTINSLSPGLIPGGCGGLVFIDEIYLSSEFLRNSTAINGEYAQEKNYTGTSSPPGCGPPSKYVVKLSITSQKDN